MNKSIVAFIILLPFVLFAQNAKIKIDIDRTIGDIDPKIYGVFMEPIDFSGARMGLPDSVRFNTLYGPLYDPSSPLANADGFRTDYIDAMKELKITNMRWPGGNFVMGYNWKDGIGPKEQRPARINLAWGGIDNNHVGTDEWIALNRAMGSENVICVNLGLGTIMDACYWVEYCNYKKGTYYSDLRIKNGHKEPYGIKIWDLGNEVDGAPWELGYKNADDYVKIAREAAKAMRSVDNSIRFVASGSSNYNESGSWVDWNHKILAGLGDMIDYISIHRYWEGSSDYYTYMGQSAMDFEEKIIVTDAQIKSVKAMKGWSDSIYISFDEWGVMGGNFFAVLPVAQCLNSFIRHADVVKMTNLTLMTSLLSTDREKGTFKSPLFYVFKMFSTNCHGFALNTHINCDTFNTEKCNGIPFLDVTSTYNPETQTVFINVVNRHKDNTISAEIICDSGNYDGTAVAQLINADSLKEPFVYDKQEQYKPVSKVIEVNGNKMSCSFPAHSITQIKVGVK